MSNYFRALERLEKSRDDGSQDAAGSVDPGRRGAARRGAEPSEPDEAQRQRFTSLLDNLRALVSGTTVPIIVLAGISGREPLRFLTENTRRQARRRGLRLRLAEMLPSGDGSVLRCLADSDAATAHPAPLEVTGNPPPEPTERWLASAAADADFLIVEGPPLMHTVDAALLARFTDGLVLVVEADRTSRLDLQNAAERARASGCSMLGLVMSGPLPRRPRWLESLLPGAVS